MQWSSRWEINNLSPPLQHQCGSKVIDIIHVGTSNCYLGGDHHWHPNNKYSDHQDGHWAINYLSLHSSTNVETIDMSYFDQFMWLIIRKIKGWTKDVKRENFLLSHALAPHSSTNVEAMNMTYFDQFMWSIFSKIKGCTKDIKRENFLLSLALTPHSSTNVEVK